MAETKKMIDDLIAVQKELKPITKDARNPHFGNTYVSLDSVIETVLPILNKYNFALVQLLGHVENEPVLTTKLIHKDGEVIETETRLLLASSTPQGQGSALTYARRYALMAILGLTADDDDDGHQATQEAQKPATATSGAKASQAQFGKMFALLKEKGGVSDRNTALAVLRSMSKNDLTLLTIAEASDIISKLDKISAEELKTFMPTAAEEEVPFT